MAHIRRVDRDIWNGSQLNPAFSSFDGISRSNPLQMLSQNKITAEARARVAVENGLVGEHLEMKQGPFSVLPYAQNRKFVGREPFFEELLSRFRIGESYHARLALFGLGGVGKSQIALEYAYRFRAQHSNASIFWIHAENRSRIEQGFNSIAEEIGIPGNLYPSTSILALVRSWLSKRLKGPWLMVLDNADDTNVFFGKLTNELSSHSTHQHQCLWDFLPQSPNSTILFTTRNKQLGLDLAGGGDLISVPPMEYSEAKLLFTSRLQTTQASEKSMKKLFDLLEYLPLAIAQAAAVIERKYQSLDQYLERYEETESAPINLLNKDFTDIGRDGQDKNAVFKTWSISFNQIRQDDMRAAELLSLMSFYDRQGIPELLLRQQLGTSSQLEDALSTLKGYSLIYPSHDGKAFDMHRLVQLCVKGWLQGHNEYSTWADAAIVTLCEAYPTAEHENWAQCALLLPHAQRIITAFPSTKSDKQATLQFNVAWYLDTQGRYDSAESLHGRALEQRTLRLGQEHTDTLMSSNGLATVLLHQGKYAQAEQLLRKTLEARRRTLGPRHEDTLTSASTLSNILWGQGKYEEAEHLLLQTLDGRKAVLGSRHKDTMESIKHHVVFLWYNGKYCEAETKIQDLADDMEEMLGPNHPSTLASKSVYASILDVLGKHKTAELLFNDLFNATKQLYGKEHPETLDCLERLSWTLANQGRFAEARQIKQQALEGYEKTLGKDHPETVASYSNLSTLLFQEGKLEAADGLMREVFIRLKNISGEDHPKTIHALCWTIRLQQLRGKFKDVYDTLSTVMAKIATWGAPNLDMLITQDFVASILYAQNRNKAAEQMYQRVIADGIKVLGKLHPETLKSKNNLAAVLQAQDKHDEAEKLYRETLAQRERVLGEEHPDTLTSKNNLAGVLQAQDKHDEAEKLYREALAQRQKVLGEEHPDTFTSLADLNVRPDINAYSHAIVNRKLHNKSDDVRSTLSEAMSDRCQGQFLWLKMQEECLRGWMNKKQLQRAIENTPTGLDRLYDHNWTKVTKLGEEGRDRAFALLRWAAFAIRPLTVCEITEAALILTSGELSRDDFPDAVDDEYIKSEVIGLCGPILEVRKGSPGSSPGRRTVHLPHFSVRQYLLCNLPTPGWICRENMLQISQEKMHCENMQQQPSINIPIMDAEAETIPPSPLYYAVRMKLMGVAINLINEQSVNEASSLGRIPLNIACADGSNDFVALLLSKGADFAMTSNDGWAPLNTASSNGHAEVVKMLLEKGADFTMANNYGWTPLNTASSNGHAEVVKMLLTANNHGWTLLDKGADIDARDRKYGNNLQAASYEGNLEVVQLLLDKGADVNAEGGRLGNALRAASSRGNLEVVQLLLDNGADVNAEGGFYGNTLQAASSRGNLEIVQLLLDNGAVVNAEGGYYGNALQAASCNSMQEIVQLLLDNGADVNAEGGFYGNALTSCLLLVYKMLVIIKKFR
ncbi:hypothetical protein FOVG_18851 [Fusarium oxysporum f. sp. pisi HDV247]|uniref:DUF7779 domain-containing protein n=1 Tax=Fusarium oxysporum f. sp. pisi HDV247 TaxID=1080344 RepID=W9NAK5_FUSOX|nr:hypothetical protein FOVG_18851 [Fusarium oxysporum f. sp. pisi HDV247]